MSTNRADIERSIDFAVEAATAAAALCRSVQAATVGAGTLTKGDKSPVTIADFGAQALVARRLEECLPDQPLMGEEDAAELRQPESARLLGAVLAAVREQRGDASEDEVLRWIDRARSEGGSGRFWCLDPIDGTKGFLRGEQYAVALALLEGGIVQVGALACPSLAYDGAPGCLLVAVRGRGATIRPLGGPGAERPVRVSSCADPAAARIVESVEAAHGDHGSHARVREALGTRAQSVRLDSQAKYAVLARGDGEVYLRLPTSEDYRENLWDQAAGAIVLEEAGGRVSDADGRPLDFTTGRKLLRNRGIVASNGRLHDALLAAVRPLRPAP